MFELSSCVWTNMIDPQLLPAHRERFDHTRELKKPLVVPISIHDSDLYATDDLPVDLGEVCKVQELPIDVKVQITTIFTEKNGETIYRNAKVEVEVSIAYLCLQAGTACCTSARETNEAINRCNSITPYKLLNIEVDTRVGELVSNLVLCIQLQRLEVSASQPGISGCERRRLTRIWQARHI